MGISAQRLTLQILKKTFQTATKIKKKVFQTLLVGVFESYVFSIVFYLWKGCMMCGNLLPRKARAVFPRYEEDSFGEGEMPRWDTAILTC